MQEEVRYKVNLSDFDPNADQMNGVVGYWLAVMQDAVSWQSTRRREAEENGDEEKRGKHVHLDLI